MAFTEFYCQSGGSNLNGGSDTNNAAKYTATNGSWNSGTFIYTPTDGTNPVSAGVAVGDFASIYIDGASVAVFIARITAVVNAVNGAITVSSTARSGTPPSTNATLRSIKVGGAWKGPNGSVTFPFNSGVFNWSAATNANGDTPRFNLKNDATYSVTAQLSPTGRALIQGYSATLGDGGKAIFDAGGTAILIVASASSDIIYIDLIAQNNGTTGVNHGFSGDLGSTYIRCVANNIRGNGFNQANTGCTFIECEAYNCNKSNTNGGGGFLVSSNGTCYFCISHDNIGSNNDGFVMVTSAGFVRFDNCIADSNGRHGFSGNLSITGVEPWIINCDAYNNGSDGIRNTQTGSVSGFWMIRNCNFIKNGGWGINSSLTTGRWWGRVENCGFGSGTQANGSGQTNNTDMLVISNSVVYVSGLTPYTDPANGVFDVILGAAISAGRGNFTTTQGGYGPTAGFEDVGAAQANATPFGGFGGAAYLPDGYVGLPYLWEAFFQVPVAVTVLSGSLPPGLVLTQVDAQTYTINGVPTTLGTYNFIIRHVNGIAHNDAALRIIISPFTGGGGGTGTASGEISAESPPTEGSREINLGGGGQGPGEAHVIEMARPTIKVRDPELANVLRRARRAARIIEDLTIAGASGSSEDGFSL